MRRLAGIVAVLALLVHMLEIPAVAQEMTQLKVGYVGAGVVSILRSLRGEKERALDLNRVVDLSFFKGSVAK